MKFKIKALAIFYCLVVVISILQSCCKQDFRITTEGSMQAWELYTTDGGGIGRKKIATIKGEFILGAYFREELISFNNTSLINACYATSCKETRLNAIIENTVQISIDEELIINNDTIPSNTDFLSIENAGIVIHNVSFGMIELKFSNVFFENATLSSDRYRFQISGETDDYVSLISSIELAVEI